MRFRLSLSSPSILFSLQSSTVKIHSFDPLQLFLVVCAMALVICSCLLYFGEPAVWDPETEMYYMYQSYDGFKHKLDSRLGTPELYDPECWHRNFTGMNLTRATCQKKLSPFQSVPHTMWFCMVSFPTTYPNEIH